MGMFDPQQYIRELYKSLPTDSTRVKLILAQVARADREQIEIHVDRTMVEHDEIHFHFKLAAGVFVTMEREVVEKGHLKGYAPNKRNKASVMLVQAYKNCLYAEEYYRNIYKVRDIYRRAEGMYEMDKRAAENIRIAAQEFKIYGKIPYYEYLEKLSDQYDLGIERDEAIEEYKAMIIETESDDPRLAPPADAIDEQHKLRKLTSSELDEGMGEDGGYRSRPSERHKTRKATLEELGQRKEKMN